MKTEITNAQLNILLEIDGMLHLVLMDKEAFKAVELVTKHSIDKVVPIDRSQEEFRKWVGLDK